MSSFTGADKEIRPGLDRPLRIGTRKSPLAMKQAELASKAIISAQGWRSDQVELVPMTATGDKIQDRPLAEIGGKALWTKELDRALEDGEIDCAVHSMKDVETIRPDIFVVSAVLERADVRDRLIGVNSLASLSRGAVVGTASPRRKALLLEQRPDLQIKLIRGNVQTRLQKIEDGEFDATLLAAAGLDRLGMEDVGKALPVEKMLPAPAQGVIGIETLVESKFVRRTIRAVSSTKTYRAVAAERGFLRALSADCNSPVAALAEIDGTMVHLRARILLPDGSECQEDSAEFDRHNVEAPGNLANKLLGRSSKELKAIFGR